MFCSCLVFRKAGKVWTRQILSRVYLHFVVTSLDRWLYLIASFSTGKTLSITWHMSGCGSGHGEKHSSALPLFPPAAMMRCFCFLLSWKQWVKCNSGLFLLLASQLCHEGGCPDISSRVCSCLCAFLGECTPYLLAVCFPLFPVSSVVSPLSLL